MGFQYLFLLLYGSCTIPASMEQCLLCKSFPEMAISHSTVSVGSSLCKPAEGRQWSVQIHQNKNVPACVSPFLGHRFRKWGHQLKFSFFICLCYSGLLWNCFLFAVTSLFIYFLLFCFFPILKVFMELCLNSHNSKTLLHYICLSHNSFLQIFFFDFCNDDWLLRIMSHGIPSSAFGRCQVTNYFETSPCLTKKNKSGIVMPGKLEKKKKPLFHIL